MAIASITLVDLSGESNQVMTETLLLNAFDSAKEFDSAVDDIVDLFNSRKVDVEVNVDWDCPEGDPDWDFAFSEYN